MISDVSNVVGLAQYQRETFVSHVVYFVCGSVFVFETLVTQSKITLKLLKLKTKQTIKTENQLKHSLEQRHYTNSSIKSLKFSNDFQFNQSPSEDGSPLAHPCLCGPSQGATPCTVSHQPPDPLPYIWSPCSVHSKRRLHGLDWVAHPVCTY